MRNLASHADILLARHEILPNDRLLKRVVKNVDQSQHTSRSWKCTLDFPKVGDRLQRS